MIPRSLVTTLLLLLGIIATGPLHAGKKDEATEKDLAPVKKMRDLAEAFMRELTSEALKQADKTLADSSTSKDKLAMAKMDREKLDKALKRKRYFDTGTERNELIEFNRQVDEAFKSGIKLNDQALQELIKAAAMHYLNDKAVKEVEARVQKQHEGATAETIRQAVSAEFRARIVRDLGAKKK